MGTVSWAFRAMSPGEINVDPIEGEFFTTEALGSTADGLVREAIQNSLDAAAGSGPVTVRFSILRGDPGGTDRSRKAYLAGLRPHLTAKRAGMTAVPEKEEPVDLVIVEDYGTRGLQGDIGQIDDLDDEIRKNDFFYFWRNVGRSQKGASDLGRWGLGKTVFQAASRVNAFFGLTVRADDRKALLMGQAVLKTHKLDRTRYAPYGYFGLFREDLALPVENKGFLARFCEAFPVDRLEKPGLSIVLPYPDPEIDPETCINSVVKHYFFPILADRLVVEVRTSSDLYRLSSKTLDAALKRARMPQSRGMPGLLELARWAIRQPVQGRVRLAEPESGKAPKLRAPLFPQANLEGLKRRFAEGKRVAFHVPVSFRRREEKEFVHAGFSVFLEKDPQLDRAEDHFIRQGITIPEVSSLKHKGVRAIVYIDDQELSTFLGDAENPAHTDWERNSKRFKSRYLLGPSTLDFVKTSPREIVKVLTQPTRSRDRLLLKHIFSVPSDAASGDGEQEVRTGGKGEEMEAAQPERFVEVAGSNYLKLTPVKQGFRLARRPKVRQVPRMITVLMAYEVRTGNPFKKYTPLDFDVGEGSLRVDADGARIVLKKHNLIQVEVLKGDFHVTVTGFDLHRDLRVRTHP